MRATAIAFVSFATAARAFAPCQSVHNARPTELKASPLDNIFSFVKGGKIGLVKSIAGDYDEDAVQSKLDSLIKKKPLLMLSFTT
mmetsp:Transcript_33763/g.60758  ORF Transcript_33763/g.60758 Transcript_33763/m.60758 type:complete len:85 (+) Transcript_33763:58-312(+)